VLKRFGNRSIQVAAGDHHSKAWGGVVPERKGEAMAAKKILVLVGDYVEDYE